MNPRTENTSGGDTQALGRVLVDRERIGRRVRELAGEIRAGYGSEDELTIVAVLTGALVFLADLIRLLDMPIRVEVVQVRSYPGRATQPHGMEFALPLTAPVTGRHVLILDDILDTGRTLAAIQARLTADGPRTLRTCVLLRKALFDDAARPPVDFVGFDVPDVFVVGYGLDYDNLYRNLPEIRELRAPVPGAAPREDRP